MLEYMYVRYTHVGARRSHKRALDSLELQLYVAVSCVMWVLGTERGSSVSGVTAFNCQTIHHPHTHHPPPHPPLHTATFLFICILLLIQTSTHPASDSDLG